MVEYIVIHHSLTKDSKTVSWGAIRKYHVQKKGWQDIGYHLGIEEVDGQLEVLFGRMPGEVGAHAREQTMNWRSIGICCVGNFDQGDPSDALIGKLSKVVRWLMEVYQVPWDHVLGHRDVTTTMRYVHMLGVDLNEVVSCVESFEKKDGRMAAESEEAELA